MWAKLYIVQDVVLYCRKDIVSYFLTKATNVSTSRPNVVSNVHSNYGWWGIVMLVKFAFAIFFCQFDIFLVIFNVRSTFNERNFARCEKGSEWQLSEFVISYHSLSCVPNTSWCKWSNMMRSPPLRQRTIPKATRAPLSCTQNSWQIHTN